MSAIIGTAAKRPPGYLEDCLAHAKVNGQLVIFTEEEFGRLQRKYAATRIRGAGDVIALAATPIARALKLDCIDPETSQLKPDSGCAKRQEKMNAALPNPFAK